MSTDASTYRGEPWVQGPAAVYDRMATALVSASPIALVGARVLDVGAGSGAASKAVMAAGGRAVALDASVDMLRHRPANVPAVVGDARNLPFPDAGFDVVVAAFVLSHVPDPVRIVAEARRVVRGGGAVLAASFSSRSVHPGKAQIDDVATRWGWRPPPWYEQLKSLHEPNVAGVAAMAGLAADAGLTDVVVDERTVDTGVSSTEEIVAWRVGMAQLAPFVASLPPAERVAFFDDARAAVGPQPQPVRPVILILSSRVRAQRLSVPA